MRRQHNSSFKSRSLSKSMHIHEWSEEVTRDTLNPCSNVSSQTKVLLLKSSLHDVKADARFILPNRHHAAIGTSWRTPQSRYGEVSFYPGYWEWTEDMLGHHANILHAAKIHAVVHASLFTYVCNKHVLQAFLELWCPSTNTLHTAVGEIFISLWDIRGLYSLPVRREFYDEVVLSSKDFLGDEICKPSVPRSCKDLSLCSTSPIHSSRKRVNGPKLSRNPSGDVDASNLPRAKDHDEPFTILHIPEDIRDETYVAAFLSCWLCNFVLPHNKVGKRLFVSLSHEGVCGLVGQVQQDYFREEYESRSETHHPNLEKGSKDNQAMPAIETDGAKPIATTSKRRHNVLVDTPVALYPARMTYFLHYPSQTGNLAILNRLRRFLT
ncbi:UNVERIFIED_CONTAM: hypothetical protein Sradi_6986900 [Sesamum radiatum]|uniref:Aminotransferase-like plant mobile domain-containing protein n=1 Tax=Sesamum radiatum TaxID=300843 RepID=A0AAW2JG41_SESRA